MTGSSLEVVAGPAAGTRLAVEATLVIGREESGRGALGGDLRLSPRHARVSPFEGGRLLVEDLGANGTLVNGRPISRPTIVGAGDAITVGATALRVVAGAAPAPSPAASAEPAAAVESDATPAAAAGGTHALPDDLLGLVISRAPVRRDWVIRGALQALTLILAINFIIRTVAVEYLGVARDISTMKPYVLLFVSVMPVIGNTIGFYMNFGRPAGHSPLRYLIPGFVIICAICTVELATLPPDAGWAGYAVTILITLVAPCVIAPTMLQLRVRAYVAAEARLGHLRAPGGA